MISPTGSSSPNYNTCSEKKSGSLKRADPEGLGADEVASRIREKGGGQLHPSPGVTNGKTLKFNVMIQAARDARIECVLEYLPEQRALHILTLY